MYLSKGICNMAEKLIHNSAEDVKKIYSWEPWFFMFFGLFHLHRIYSVYGDGWKC